VAGSAGGAADHGRPERPDQRDHDRRRQQRADRHAGTGAGQRGERGAASSPARHAPAHDRGLGPGDQRGGDGGERGQPAEPDHQRRARVAAEQACGAIQTSAHHSAPTRRSPPTSRQAAEMPARRAHGHARAGQRLRRGPAEQQRDQRHRPGDLPSDSPPARATLSGPR
jgi:hypothetical protein